MTEAQTIPDIQDIFKTYLKIEAKVMAIDTLFAERRARKTNYAPAYQRKYVWDTDKATYFIESILLGTEIPPIIFFNSGEKIEVIDGRQRYETIKRFIEGEFKLRKKSLLKLKDLANKKFEDLDALKDVFWDTKLRLIEFSFRDPSLYDPLKEDKAKKEIFKRYNSGITPLKSVEIDKAKYDDNFINKFFTRELKKNITDRKTVWEIFFFDAQLDLDKALRKIRQQIILPSIPINYYANTKLDTIDRFFQYLSSQTENSRDIYTSFINKIYTLKELKDFFDASSLPTNRLVFECLFWGLSILEKEELDYTLFFGQENKQILLDHLSKYITSYKTEDSHFYKQVIDRYEKTADIFNKISGVNFSIYINNNPEFRSLNRQLAQVKTDATSLSVFESLRLNRPDASSNAIDDICNRMTKERFLIRPSYQRKEVIDGIKSSAIIESILLGIKLPPIFVYKRNDGVTEVLDGQQRLLSILGFIGKEFLNENREMTYSEKNNYALQKLEVLKEMEKKRFSDLSDELQDRILDFDLWIIEITQKNNPDFNPIDLFLRLNTKPYPILENTFEMWNSYIDREIINEILPTVERYNKWFYLRKDNRRMDNENLLTYLAFLDSQVTTDTNGYKTAPQILDIYIVGSRVNIRIKVKREITNTLNNPAKKTAFIQSCKNIENDFVLKIKTLLGGTDDPETLKNSLDKLLNIKTSKRSHLNFYSLWYILLNIPMNAIIKQQEAVKHDVEMMLIDMKSLNHVESFHKKIASLSLKYS